MTQPDPRPSPAADVREPTPVPVPEGYAGVFPASFAQERLWFLDRLEPGSPFYNVPFASRLPGKVDIDGLGWSLNEIVRRHESLRTRFITLDGMPYQAILPELILELPVVDRREVPAPQRQAEALRWMRREAQRPFVLSRGPLVRARLLRIDDDDHLLLVTLHHIVSDAWSLGIFFRELSILYESYCTGRRSSPLPEVPIQYADYSQWQRHWLRGEVLESFLVYWRQRLAGVPAVAELPTDRPRPPLQSFRGELLHFELPVELHQRLAGLGRARGATLFMVLVAAFKTLLFRYSGLRDQVVGCPVANRNRAEIEKLIGFFVNTLVLRSDLSNDPTFLGLLERVEEVTLGAFDHQDLPFEKLVAELQPERNLSLNPLFQVMFSLQNATAISGGDRVSQEPSPLRSEAGTGTAKFDLALLMGEDDRGLFGALEFNTDLFEEATAQRMLSHFLALLLAVVERPERRLSEIPLLSDGERRQILEAWNDTRSQPPVAAGVHQLVQARAGKVPDSVSVVFGDEHLSYRQLLRSARLLAGALERAGVGCSQRVGLSAERSIALVTGVLGILEAGAACVPLDPSYPKERLRLMLATARTAVLVTQERLLERLPTEGLEAVLFLDGGLADDPRAARVPTPSGLDLSYVLYTSGSTGRPKAVAMHHRAISNLVAWQLRQSAPAPCTLQFASPSFDVSFQEIFSTWAAGGRLVLVNEEERRDTSELLAVLARQRVQRLFLPPVALQQIAEAAGSAPAPAALTEVVTAGEALRISPEISAFVRRLPACALVNHYGPTESHVCSSFTLTGDPASWPSLPPLGWPVSNSSLYLLDARLEPVPVGAVGEIHIGGVAVARGYLEAPRETAGRFVPDPFGGDAGMRLYRTGDLGRYLPDGAIRFLGRRDFQVKIRGFRIETGEIEVHLARHPAISQVVVSAQRQEPGGLRLVAYLVSAAIPKPSVSELRAFLREKLPEYMLPSVFQYLEAVPLTPTGKVNRQALPAPEAARPKLAHSFLAPRTEMEERLAAVWCKLLRLPRVGVEDNFFELGGHSLLATQLLSRVRDVFGVEIPLRRVFEAPTVAQLASVVVETRAEKVEEGLATWLLREIENLTEEEVQTRLAGVASG